MGGFVRLFVSALLAVAAVGAIAAGAGWWLYREVTGPGPLAAAQTIVIPPRTGLGEVAELLTREGVVRYRVAFEVGVFLSGNGAALMAGEYRFPPATSALEAGAIIASGKTVRHKLTIPEGLTNAEVLTLVGAAPALAGGVGPTPPEGSLMPDTYFYSYGDQRQALVRRMQAEMSEVLARVWAKRRPDLPLDNPGQLLVLASLVEAEAARADDRARIAAVFVNRLRLGMPLDCDPSVIYAVSEGGARKLDRRLTRADLDTPSPYNTYLEKGLPPGPIDNPGLAALQAAAQPAPIDDLYFVADGDGGHVFARTLAEHNRNVAQYRRAQAGAADPPGPAGH